MPLSKWPRLAALLLVYLIILPSNGGAEPTEPASLQGLDDYVTDAMAAWETPGLGIAVVKDGRVVLAKGYGVRHQGQEAPVDAETVFAVASITKGFTSAALAMLVGQERLRWNDRVVDHLADFRLHDPYVTRDIRIRDLLSHRSGLPRGGLLWYYSGFDRAEIMRRLRYLEPVAPFRSRFGYQNLMFLAAGEVIAAVYGRSWDAFVTEKIFAPLGMHGSSTTVRDLRGNVATPHARIDGQVTPIDWLNIDNIGPAGSINANVRDMAKWIRFQLANGAWEGQPLIRPKDVAEMRTAQTVIRVSPRFRKAIPHTHLRAYGLGWYLADYRDEKLVYHSGRIDGMSSYLALLPNRNLGVVVLTNQGRSSLPNAISYRVVDAYLGGPPRDWSGDFLVLAKDSRSRRREKRDTLLAQRPTDTRPSLPLARFAGAYDSALYGGVDVRLRDGALVLRRNSAAIADLTHWDVNTYLARFRNPALRDRLVTFRLDKLGQVNGLDFEYAGAFEAMDPPLPFDLAIAGTTPETAGATADLIGVWTGRWNGVLPHTLVVESIDGDTAKVVYAWGRSTQWKVEKRGWRRLTGELHDGRLTLSLSNAITASYRLQPNGTLQADYTDGSRKRRAAMRRAP